MSNKLKVSVHGQAERKAADIVFIHGWGVNSGVWDSILPQLTGRFRVTCIDLPGFGINNQVVVEPYSLSNLATLVSEVLPPNCSLVGWSLGGLVAQQVALQHSDKLAKLITVCSSPKFVSDENWQGMAPRVLAQFYQQLQHDFSKTLDRFLAIQAMGSNTARQDMKRLKQSIEAYPTPSIEALSGGLKLLETSDLRDELVNLKLPYHAFLGRLDSLVPVAIGPKLIALNPDIAVETFHHCSHAPFISNPEDFVKKLLACV